METSEQMTADAPTRGRDETGSGATPESSTTEQAQAAARSIGEQVKERARNLAEEEKSAGADQLGRVAAAMEKASDELEKAMPSAAQAIDDMAHRLGELASSLRQRSVDDMLNEASAFGRRRPGTFFVGAVAAGFALSRFVKSSADR
jgi:molecular chaperone DnaK (HSP70)